MIKIAIVEDEKECEERLKRYIEKYCSETGEKVELTYFSDGDEIISDYSANFDIIFLDIVMKHLDGITTAEMIRKKDKAVLIVFITSMAQFAIKGYTVDALSFLLKPLTYFAFSQEFKRCIDKLKEKNCKYLLFSTENGMDRIATDDILFIESLNHKMLITTREKEYSVYDTMKNMEESLAGEGFARCNNCYLVNLAYATGVHGEFVLVGEHRLKISRHKRKSFLEELTKKFAAH